MIATDRPTIPVCLLLGPEGGDTEPACGDRLRGLAWHRDPDAVTCPACRDTEAWRAAWREKRAERGEE